MSERRQAAVDPFESTFRRGGGFSRWFAFTAGPAILRLLMRLGMRTVRLGRVRVVFGADLVREVLERSRDFPIPHDVKTDALGWHPPFLLGIPDSPGREEEYDDLHQTTRCAWAGDVRDDCEGAADEARETAQSARTMSGVRVYLSAPSPNGADHEVEPLRNLRATAEEAFTGLLSSRERSIEFEAVHEYTLPGFMEIVRRYYGLDISDQDQFVRSLLVVSRFFFARPGVKPSRVADAEDAFEFAMGAIETALQTGSCPRGTVLARLRDGRRDEGTISSAMLGMTLGFIPTSLNAHVRALDVFIRNRTAMECLRTAVEHRRWSDSVEDEELRAVCHEAIRMNYVLPGLWRTATQHSALGTGGRPVWVKERQRLLVSTQAAMMDSRRVLRPSRFDPRRPLESSLIYGRHRHACVGWDISDVVLEEYFRALVRSGFAGNGPGITRWRGSFPWECRINLGDAT